MLRIPFRFIFPVASFAFAALLIFSSHGQKTVSDSKGEVGWDTSAVDYASPPLAAELVMAMYLPAIVAVGPVLISGLYLMEIYPVHSKGIEILGMVAVCIAGFLQWYWIGRLLEVQLGYRTTFADRKFSKRGQLGNAAGIVIAALLGLLGAFVAFQPGGMTIGIIGALWASACLIGLVRIRRARKHPSSDAIELSLR